MSDCPTNDSAKDISSSNTVELMLSQNELATRRRRRGGIFMAKGSQKLMEFRQEIREGLVSSLKDLEEEEVCLEEP